MRENETVEWVTDSGRRLQGRLKTLFDNNPEWWWVTATNGKDYLVGTSRLTRIIRWQDDTNHVGSSPPNQLTSGGASSAPTAAGTFGTSFPTPPYTTSPSAAMVNQFYDPMADWPNSRCYIGLYDANQHKLLCGSTGPWIDNRIPVRHDHHRFIAQHDYRLCAAEDSSNTSCYFVFYKDYVDSQVRGTGIAWSHIGKVDALKVYTIAAGTILDGKPYPP